MLGTLKSAFMVAGLASGEPRRSLGLSWEPLGAQCHQNRCELRPHGKQETRACGCHRSRPGPGSLMKSGSHSHCRKPQCPHEGGAWESARGSVGAPESVPGEPEAAGRLAEGLGDLRRAEGNEPPTL